MRYSHQQVYESNGSLKSVFATSKCDNYFDTLVGLFTVMQAVGSAGEIIASHSMLWTNYQMLDW